MINRQLQLNLSCSTIQPWAYTSFSAVLSIPVGTNLISESSENENESQNVLEALPSAQPIFLNDDEEFNEEYNNQINEPLSGFDYEESQFQYEYENPVDFPTQLGYLEGLGGEGKWKKSWFNRIGTVTIRESVQTAYLIFNFFFTFKRLSCSKWK